MAVRSIVTHCVTILVCTFAPISVSAQLQDPLDPFDRVGEESGEFASSEDSEASATELIQRSVELLIDERPLDARSKLLLALKKDPTAYRAHILLSSYYMVHVGHYRLALSYITQAARLFRDQYGSPPYYVFIVQEEHKQILYLQMQAKLNLDNYRGALEVLDDFAELGYMDDWYAGSRAWVLMKMGKVDEAIKVAQSGFASLRKENEKGQILNMLGILYSMRNERNKALEIFKQAVAHELSLGKRGQPATPLNNAGEVYKEIFEEDKAEVAWKRATAQKDGCDHVLPALNLAIMFIEQLNLSGAKKAIDGFEACIAEFPLKNGEEHRALVHLARGRIALHAGDVDGAINHLRESLRRKQWFGKIGTSELDLQAASMVSLSQALDRKIKRGELMRASGFWERSESRLESLKLEISSWWYMRRARQLLTEDLSQFEDLYIRNTDSLLEYSTLGEVVSGISTKKIINKLEALSREDSRVPAHTYYSAYMADYYISNGEVDKAQKLIRETLLKVRPKFDESLRLRLLLLQLSLYPDTSPEYRQIAYLVYSINRAALFSYGYRLPVNFSVNDAEVSELLHNSPLLLDNTAKLQYVISSEVRDGEYILSLKAMTGVIGNMRVKSANLDEAVHKFINEIFLSDLS